MWCRSTACALAVAIAWPVLGGCDQFAAVGVAPLQLDGGDVGSPDPQVELDASGPTQPPVRMADAARVADAGDAATPVDAATLEDAGAACVPPAVTGCNPVTNEGCPAALGMQCAVDLAATLSGYCIFTAPPAPGMPDSCLNTLVTESCAPMSACVEGVCSRLCFCDSDCEPGQCCKGPIAAHGFSACGEC